MHFAEITPNTTLPTVALPRRAPVYVFADYSSERDMLSNPDQPLDGIFDSIKGVVTKPFSYAKDKVVSSGTYLGSLLKSTGNVACKTLTNPVTQAAGGIAAQVPNPYAQGGAFATQVGAAMCSTTKQPPSAMAAAQQYISGNATTAQPPATPTAAQQAANLQLLAQQIQPTPVYKQGWFIPVMAASAIGLGAIVYLSTRRRS